MKHFIFFLLFGLSSAAFGYKSLGKIAPYTIVSDVKESAVPLGYCLVKGFAIGGGAGIVNGKVSTLNGIYKTSTDSTGAYYLLIPVSDTSIFFFKPEYDEIVVWNYDFKSQHVVTLNFYSEPNVIMKVSFKPVIYLYSDKEISVSLDLNYHGDLTFTYPELNDGWQVRVHKGEVRHKELVYPYLFWEGESKVLKFNVNEDNSVNGELVEKTNVVHFLEEKLDNLGFNQTEKTDFITFWAPKMIQSNYALVQFVLDEDYETQIANLKVDPKPASSRRVYMYFTAFEKNPEIETNPQSFTGFERTGFTLFEWGGSQIQLEQINL